MAGWGTVQLHCTVAVSDWSGKEIRGLPERNSPLGGNGKDVQKSNRKEHNFSVGY